MPIKVISHTLDHAADPPVYRLVAGTEVVARVEVGRRTETVAEEVPYPQTEEEVAEGAEQEVHTIEREVVVIDYEDEVHYVGTFDVVFAADDGRWSGKDPEEIAALQRELVSAQLDQQAREQETAEQEPKRMHLPGAGEAL